VVGRLLVPLGDGDEQVEELFFAWEQAHGGASRQGETSPENIATGGGSD
jgi:hypothetical protein